MVDRKEIEKVLYELLNEAGMAETDENSNILLTKEVDSIQLISTIVEIEERFAIEIPDEYLVTEFFDDMQHVIDVVEELMNKSV